MFNSVKMGLLVAYLASGVWLYVRWELGTDPTETLLPYAALWVVVGIAGAALLLRKPPQPGPSQPDRGTTPNPYERMWPEERERARAILNARLSGRAVATEDANWLAVLLERYAPLLTQAQQMDRFTDYLASVPVKAPTEPARLAADARQAEPPPEDGRAEELHDGPAIVLARAARRPGFDVTRDGTSWFGGLPALGGQPWPLDENGRPMTPLAQIDLTGLAGHLKIPGVPETGSLVFLAALPETSDWVGRVVYVRTPGSPTQPPGPLPPVLNHSFGGPMRRGEPGDHQRMYPRMAMDLVPIRAPGRSDRKAFDAELKAALGPGRKYNLSASLFKEAMPDPKRPLNRDSLRRFLHGARIALASGAAAETSLKKTQASYENSIKALTEKLAGETPEREVLQAKLENAKATLKRLDGILADFPAATRRLVEELETMEAWAQMGNRWAPLTEAEQDMLAPLLEPWTTSQGLGNAHLDRTYQIHRYMNDCVSETLLAMAVAEDGLFGMLPEPVREAINGPWRQPYDRSCHQMFGCPDSVQVAAEENEHARLLLQLQCDDIAGFHWGDAGVLQYWIRPADLEAGRWDRAYMTFEGH